MARRIFITGDAQGSAVINDNEDVIINVSVKRALTAKLADEVSVIAYAKSAGDAVKSATSELSARCSGNSKTATQLKDARKITLSGDVDAEIYFDGANDVVADVKIKKANCDSYGNDIFDTYLKKSDLMFSEYNGKPCLIFSRNGRLYKFIGEEV